MSEPQIPHGYRLVSGPHTAAEVEEGWTITAEWMYAGDRYRTGWQVRPHAQHDGDSLCAVKDDHMQPMCPSDDPERDIYRIEKVTS